MRTVYARCLTGKGGLFTETVESIFSSDADAAFYCKGDSMQPTIFEGDYVLIRRQKTIPEGRIAAVKYKNTLLLKRIFSIRDEYMLVSDNPKYGAICANKSDVEVIGIALEISRSIY